MPFVVGLDIGSRYLKGAVLAGTASKFRLVDFFIEEIPSMESQPKGPDGETVVPPGPEEFIAKVLADRHLKGAEVVAAVESRDCVIRQFQVQFTRDEQIRRVISFAAEEYFPAFSMDEVVLEYLKVGESNGKSQLIVAALRNETIERRLSMLQKAGIDPVALDLDASALVNASALTAGWDPEKSVLLLDLGATSARIVLVEGGRIRKIRSFRTSAMAVGPDRRLAQPAGPPPKSAASPAAGGARPEPAEAAEAAAVGAATATAPRSGATAAPGTLEERFDEIEAVLRTIGDGVFGQGDVPVAIVSDDEFAQILDEGGQEGAGRVGVDGTGDGTATADDVAAAADRPMPREQYLERIAAEIHRTFVATRAKIDRICLTGGLGAGEETARFFSDEFGVEAVHLDFEGSLAADTPPDRLALASTHGAVAVGLALKEFGKDLGKLDFRKGRFRYERRFSKLRLPLLLLSVLAFLFFLQTAFWAYHQHQRHSLREAHIQTQMRSIYKAFFDKDVVAGRDPYPAAKTELDGYGKGGMGDVGKTVNAVDAIRNVGEVMKSTGLIFDISSMKFEFELRQKPTPGVAKKMSWQAVADSQIELVAKDDRAVITFEQAFAQPASKFFSASGSSSPTKDGESKVTLFLKLKPEFLAKLEE